MAAGDLCTLADVKAWLTLGTTAFPATDDTMLNRLIAAVSAFIVQWCGRPILTSSWREVRGGSGGSVLVPAYYPVTAVSALTVDGVTIPAGPVDGSFSAGYVFGPNAISLNGYTFTRRAGNVSLTYTAGYATTPLDIAQAAIELVCLRYRERSRIGEVSKVVGTETVTFLQKDMSDDVRTVLNPYRRVFPAVTIPVAVPSPP